MVAACEKGFGEEGKGERGGKGVLEDGVGGGEEEKRRGKGKNQDFDEIATKGEMVSSGQRPPCL